MAEMVLDELQGLAGVEEVGRDRVPEGVGRESRRQACGFAVFDKPGLDLTLAERAAAAGKERSAFRSCGIDDRGKRIVAPGEEGLLGPVPAL